MICSVVLAHVAGLLGCPQLLDDGFDTVRSSPDAGLGGMTFTGRGGTAGSGGSESGGTGGSAGSGGSSGNAGTGGTGGTQGGTGGAAGTGGTGGTGGTAGTGGAAGTAGSSAGTGGTGGTGGDTPACWTFELTTKDADADSNCVGIDGWNDIAVEAPTSVSLSYEDGDICFNGTIGPSGWATYNYVFAGGGEEDDGLVWDATEFGVAGFELTTSGDALPTSFKVTYAVNRDEVGFTDYCQTIGTGPALVPFAGTSRENCGGSGTGTLTDTTELEALRLSFPVSGTYAVDFCLHIRAF